MGMLAEKINNR